MGIPLKMNSILKVNEVEMFQHQVTQNPQQKYFDYIFDFSGKPNISCEKRFAGCLGSGLKTLFAAH